MVERGQGLVSDSILEGIVDRVEAEVGLHRAPCHRDFGPHNWLIHGPQERLCVIDFGQARPDVWLSDLVKLVPTWLKSPQHKRAFFAGYGRALDEAQVSLLRGMLGLYAVGSIVWGAKNGELRAQTEGREWIEAFSDEASWDRF
jgi:Ser/Thr protein kinase RdoA (MazF antagonist)